MIARNRDDESQARAARQAATRHFQPRASHRSGVQLAPRDTASDERDWHGDKPVARAPTFDALHRVPRPVDVPGPTGQKQEPGHTLGVIARRARTFRPMRLPQVQTFPQGSRSWQLPARRQVRAVLWWTERSEGVLRCRETGIIFTASPLLFLTRSCFSCAAHCWGLGNFRRRARQEAVAIASRARVAFHPIFKPRFRCERHVPRAPGEAQTKNKLSTAVQIDVGARSIAEMTEVINTSRTPPHNLFPRPCTALVHRHGACRRHEGTQPSREQGVKQMRPKRNRLDAGGT